MRTPAPRIQWLADGGLLETRTEKNKSSYARIDPKTGDRKPFLDPDAVAVALGKAGAAEAEAKRALTRPVWNDAMDAALFTLGSDFYHLKLAGTEARRLTKDGKPKDEPLFSPDGKKVAFLRENDLHVLELESGQEIRLTRDGSEERLNGRLDWVYDEEVFGRGNKRAFWWSPDSRLLAFLQLDVSKEPTHILIDDRTQPQQQKAYRYPKAGDPNPVARLGVADLQGTLGWMENPYPLQETLVVQVGWDPRNRLLAAFQDRTQTWLDLRRFEGGRGRSLIIEKGKAWQDRLPLPTFLQDGGFLWLSDRTGFRHVYRYGADGNLLRSITEGPWDVLALHGADESRSGRDAKNRPVYFSGTLRGSTGLDAYSVALEGKAPNAKLSQLTEKPGTHLAAFSKDLNFLLVRWSDATTPTQTQLLGADGKLLRSLDPGTPSTFPGPLGTVKFQKVKARDGVELETQLILPPGFDPKQKYPVVQSVYGGPSAFGGFPSSQVRNAYGRAGNWANFLANKGYIVFVVDPRSAAGKGPASAHVAYKRLGEQELADLEDSLAWLGTQGFADLGRVAIEGWSYGGFMVTYALTHSDKYKVGVAGAPVTDWRLYDSIYTERYMGLPKDNPAGYDKASVVKAAANLKGKLLLFHGTLDDNVHPQNSIQLLDALQKAGKDADLVLLPGSGHGPRTPEQIWVRYKRMWEFIKANL
jgi:dipeptidyl-peptidase-4